MAQGRARKLRRGGRPCAARRRTLRALGAGRNATASRLADELLDLLAARKERGVPARLAAGVLVGPELVAGVAPEMFVGLDLGKVEVALLLVGGERPPGLAGTLRERDLLRRQLLALVALDELATEEDEGVRRTRGPLGILAALHLVAAKRGRVLEARDVAAVVR